MGMIKLDERYSIETDSNNFTLKYEEKIIKEIKGEKKEMTSKDEWHYPKLSQCLNKYMNQSLKPLEDIVSLRQELKKIEEVIKNVKNAKT
jgi:hypothetical protein